MSAQIQAAGDAVVIVAAAASIAVMLGIYIGATWGQRRTERATRRGRYRAEGPAIVGPSRLDNLRDYLRDEVTLLTAGTRRRRELTGSRFTEAVLEERTGIPTGAHR